MADIFYINVSAKYLKKHYRTLKKVQILHFKTLENVREDVVSLSISFISFPVCCNELHCRTTGGRVSTRTLAPFCCFRTPFLCICAFVFLWSTQKSVVVVVAEPASCISAGLGSNGWRSGIRVVQGHHVLRAFELWTSTLLILLSFQNPNYNLPFCPLNINLIVLAFYPDDINVREEWITSLLN